MQQAAGVAVACQQQFGLLGVVRRDFGVEQPLAVAAAALRRFARFQNGNAHAVFRQLARGRGAGSGAASDYPVDDDISDDDIADDDLSDGDIAEGADLDDDLDDGDVNEDATSAGDSFDTSGIGEEFSASGR